MQRAQLATPEKTTSRPDPTRRSAERSASTVGIADNRPGAAAQRDLSVVAETSPAVMQQKSLLQAASRSPVAMRQRVFSGMVADSPRVLQQKAFADAVQGVQTSIAANESSPEAVAQREPEPNRTGLPDRLKAGVESLSGMSLDGVKVHYNSSQPEQLNAMAYAQGSDIHVGPGQERHLPHEAWHVAQQAQGRVQPTMQMKRGIAVNNDKGLEHEANVMGARALAANPRGVSPPRPLQANPGRSAVHQGIFVGEIQRLTHGDVFRELKELGYQLNPKEDLAFLAGLEKSTTEEFPTLKSLAVKLKLRKTADRVALELKDLGYEVNPSDFESIVLNQKSHNPVTDLTALAGLLHLKQSQERREEIGGRTIWTPRLEFGEIAAVASQKEHSEFGKLQLHYQFTASGLEFTAEVASNPKLMWKQGDTVSVVLQPDTLKASLGELRMFPDHNAVTITAKLSFENLRKLCRHDGVLSGSAKDKRDQLASTTPQLGVLAIWRTVEGKGEQHRSGGIDQKGGSGLINVLTTISVETLAKTEQIRNIGWNEGELLKPGRPVYDKFPNLFKLGEEMATTLEAESEYFVSGEVFGGILAAMAGLASKDEVDLMENFLITKKPSPDVKVYTDTYYDLDVPGQEGAFPLLESNIVFRRRSVPTDKEGTNLIAVKGRSVASGEEAIRLAAQINAQYDLLDKGKQEEVRNFLKSQEDNAFGRVLRDALKKVGREELLNTSFTLKKSLTVRSERVKYKLWLANQTMIDFSADKAFGSTESQPENEKFVVYSFEFGVGHPGLVATATGGGGLAEVDPQLEAIRQKQNQVLKLRLESEHLAKRGALIHRPYHVPADLDYPGLVQKDDYKQYMLLRNTIIDKLFGLPRQKLEKGGNKAARLAKMMNLQGK